MSKKGDLDKFTTKAGDFKIQRSQCSECKENTSVEHCDYYGMKPTQFAMNEMPCPNRKPNNE